MEIGVVINPVVLLLLALLLLFFQYFLSGHLFAILSGLFLFLSLLDFILLGFPLYEVVTWGIMILFFFYLLVKITKEGGQKKWDYLNKLIDKEAVVLTDLRPKGKVWIEDKVMAARAEEGILSLEDPSSEW